MGARIRIGLINGSPKPKKSTSKKILDALEARLSRQAEILHIMTTEGLVGADPVKEVRNCDVLVLAFPLYVDAIPSHLISVMEDLSDREEGGDRRRPEGEVPETAGSGIPAAKRVYIIVNCGFMDADYTGIAIDMTRVWCAQAGFLFSGAIGFGGGGMGPSLQIGRGPGRSVGRALDRMAEDILAGKEGETIFTRADLPLFLYNRIGNRGWTKAARRRGLKKKDLYRTDWTDSSR